MAVQCQKVALVPERKAARQKTRLTQGKNNMAKHDDDNRSRQLDPEHDAYWQSRGEDERPDDWQDRLEDEQ